jgi:hypothetical protein
MLHLYPVYEESSIFVKIVIYVLLYLCEILRGTRGSMRNLLQEADESLNFDEMILEAAKSIAAATSALVKAASAAQRELIDQGKVQKSSQI